MQANKKNNNGWILCPSKSFPGKLYYFNVINGEAAWSLNDVEKSLKQDHTIQNVVDKSHSIPEPDTPPLDDTIGSNIPCYQPVPNYLANIPSQRFGEPVFPKYFSTVAAPVFWAPIQMFVPPEATKITSSQITQTFEPRCILRHQTDIPLSKRFSKPIFDKEIRFENRFKTNKFCDTSTPNKQPTVEVKFNKSLTNPKESIFEYPKNLPVKITFQRTRSESEINTVPNIFNNVKQNSNLNLPNSLSKPNIFNDVKQNSTLNLPNSLSKPNRSTFTQTPSWTISTLTPNQKVENPANISLAKNFLSKSDEYINTVDQKSTLKISSEVADSNGTEEMYNQLDSEDLRFWLCAKRRISVDYGELTEGKKSKSNVTNVTAKKRVTFDLGDVNNNASEDNESDCYDIMEEVRNPSIDFLRNLAKPSMNKQCWYLVVDTEVLLDEYDFIDKFVKSDEKCKLLIPYVVRRDIETMSKGDCCGRHRIIVARQLCRRLCMPGDHVVLQPDLGDDKKMVTNAILNCCIEIKIVRNRHVILITNDTVLLNKAKTLNIYGYKLQEIKDGVVPPQKVTFDIKSNRNENLFLQNDLRNQNSEQFKDLFSNNSKNLPILDDKIINITKPKNLTKPNMDSTINYEYDTVDSSSEIGRDINKMNIKDTSQFYMRKSLFEDENQSKFTNATKSTKLSYIEEDIKRFYVKNKLMEEKIKLRIDEWICTFSQIMEDILTDILLKISSRFNKPPPWYLCEAIECIKLMYAKHPTVVTVLNKFSLILFNCSCKKGKLKSSMNAKDFINILGYGITLLQTIQTVTPSQGVSEAQEKLDSMLRTIEDPSIESDNDFVTPVVRRTEVTKAAPTKRYNFQKNRADIIKYLQKHIPQWECYNEEFEKHNYDENTYNENKVPKIFRTFGKNLGQLKIDNNKNISMELPREPLSLAIGRNKETDGPKVIRTVKDVVINKRQDVETTKYLHKDVKNNDAEIAVPKFKRILKTTEERMEGPKFIRNLEKSDDFLLKNSANQSMKKGNIKVVFRSDINNSENDLNIPKHGITFEVRDESKEGPKIIRTFGKVNSFIKSRNLQGTDSTLSINKCALKNEPKVTVNMKIIDTFEEKIMKKEKEQNFDDLDYEFDDSLSNINSNNISQISIDNCKFADEERNNAYLPDHVTTRINTRNHSNDEKDKLENNIGNQTTNETNEMSITTVTSVFFSDSYQRDQNHDATNIGFASHRDDTTNDSGFENESLQAYSLAKSFLNEVSSSFKMIYQFIDKSINEVRDEELQEDKKKILYYKANRTHLHIAQVIDKLKSIIERESNDGTTLKSFLIKVGDASGDKRMSRYRQVVTKSLEQAQMLENALKLMLNIIDDDFTGPPSFTTDNRCNSLKYYNIFE